MLPRENVDDVIKGLFAHDHMAYCGQVDRAFDPVRAQKDWFKIDKFLQPLVRKQVEVLGNVADIGSNVFLMGDLIDNNLFFELLFRQAVQCRR